MLSCFCKKKKKDTSLTLYYNDNNALDISGENERIIISNIKKSKLNTIELLDYSITNIETKLSIVKKEINEHIKILEGTKNKVSKKLTEEIASEYLCPICFTNKKNTILTPCGHTLCDACLGEAEYCFFCRKYIGEKFRIYQ